MFGGWGFHYKYYSIDLVGDREGQVRFFSSMSKWQIAHAIFKVAGLFQFCVLPFGLFNSLLVFNKLCKSVVRYPAIGRSTFTCIWMIGSCVTNLTNPLLTTQFMLYLGSLGFEVHPSKSLWDPSTRFNFGALPSHLWPVHIISSSPKKGEPSVNHSLERCTPTITVTMGEVGFQLGPDYELKSLILTIQ